jgi:hypothetical protein
MGINGDTTLGMLAQSEFGRPGGGVQRESVSRPCLALDTAKVKKVATATSMITRLKAITTVGPARAYGTGSVRHPGRDDAAPEECGRVKAKFLFTIWREFLSQTTQVELGCGIP